MNKFLANFQRTGAMYPVTNNMFSDWWGGGKPAENAGTDVSKVSEESKQASGGSSQIAVGVDNANKEDKPINIWDEKRNENGEIIKEEEKPALFNDLTHEQAQDFASKVEVLTPEDENMIKVLAGDDPEKANAMRQLMTNVGRRALAEATYSSIRATGTGVSNELKNQDPKVADLVNRELTMNALTEEFPMASDPNTAPVFKSIAQQVMKTFPSASRREIMEKTQEQLNLIVKSAGQTPTSQSKQTATSSSNSKNNSWDTFFESNGR